MKQERTLSSLVIGLSIYLTGATLNIIASLANRGSMPVFIPECTGQSGAILDHIHICAGPTTHLNFIADNINLGNAVISIGDVGLLVGTIIILPILFKELDRRYAAKVTKWRRPF